MESRVKRVSSAARLTDDMVCLKNGQTRGTRTVNDCCMLQGTEACVFNTVLFLSTKSAVDLVD